MTNNEQVFKRVRKNISIDSVVSRKRAEKLVKLLSLSERRKLAEKFNRSLTHFKENFIKNFVGYDGTVGKIKDFSSHDKVKDPKRGGIPFSWVKLSKQWENKKKRRGVQTPNFFKFGQSANLKSKAGKVPANRPAMTLEQYIEANWSNIIEQRFGKIKSTDIIFKDAKGRDLTKAAANAKSAAKGKGVLGDDNPFAYLLKDRKTDFQVTEEITIGFTAFGSYGSKLEQGENRALSLDLSKLFIPITENTQAQGFPLSKLTNNTEVSKPFRGPLRPTLVPLLQWYYQVKLPTILRNHYKRKF